MTHLPPGEVTPLPREEAIGQRQAAEIGRILRASGNQFGPGTEAAMGRWLAAVLCGYRLELVSGQRVLKGSEP